MLGCFLVVIHFVMRRLGIAYRASVLMIRKASCRATNAFLSSHDLTSPSVSYKSRRHKSTCPQHETTARDLECPDPTEGMGTVVENYPDESQYYPDMQSVRPDPHVCEAEVTPSRCVNGPIPPSCTDPNWPPNRPKSIQARAMNNNYYTNGQAGATTYAPSGWNEYQTDARSGYPPDAKSCYQQDATTGYQAETRSRYQADTATRYQADTATRYEPECRADAKSGYMTEAARTGYAEMKSLYPAETVRPETIVTKPTYNCPSAKTGYQTDATLRYTETGYQTDARKTTMSAIYGPETKTLASTYGPGGNVYCPDGYNLVNAQGGIEPRAYGLSQVGTGYERRSTPPTAYEPGTGFADKYSTAGTYGYNNGATMNSHVLGSRYQVYEDKIGTQNAYTGYEKNIPVQCTATSAAYGTGGTAYKAPGTTGAAYGQSGVNGTSFGTSVGTSYGTSMGTSYGATRSPPTMGATGKSCNNVAPGTTVGGQSRGSSPVYSQYGSGSASPKCRPPVYQMEEEFVNARVPSCPKSSRTKKSSSQEPIPARICGRPTGFDDALRDAIPARQCGRPTGFDDGPLPRPVPQQNVAKCKSKTKPKSAISALGSAITSAISSPNRRGVKSCKTREDGLDADTSVKTGYPKSATGVLVAGIDCSVPASTVINTCLSGQNNLRSTSGNCTPTSPSQSVGNPYSATGTRMTNISSQHNNNNSTYCPPQPNGQGRGGNKYTSAVYSVRASGIRSVSQQDMTHTDLPSVIYDPMRGVPGVNGRRKAPYNVIDCANDDSVESF